MAITFHDTFVGTAGQDLVVRTPDTVGTGWLESRTHASLQEIDVSGRADATAVQASGNHVYRGQPDTAGAEYDVEGVPSAVDVAGDDSWYLVGRYAGVANDAYGYHHAGGVQKLYKKDGGTVTQLATLTETIAANDLLKLEIRDATKKCYRNGVEKLSSTDNAVTAKGEAGFGLGNLFVSTEDIEISWDTTEIKITEVAAAPASFPPISRPLQALIGR